jgi:signal transduction histidine kinase
MFPFETRTFTRLLVYGLAALILLGSLVYSNYLAERLAVKEAQGVKFYTDGLDFVGNFDISDPYAVDNALDFIQQQLIQFNDSLVPLILVGEEGDISSIHLQLNEDSLQRAQQLQDYIDAFSELHEPIRVEFAPGRYQYVYYGESFILQQLRWFPFAQLLVAFVFIGVVFAGFAVAKRNEHNRVWVGLAKETAHQLGTPVSSLMAWVELLKLRTAERPEDAELANEMERDVKRLQDIAERFSKIGSKPDLEEVNLRDVLDRSARYLRKRMTRRGSIRLKVENELPGDSKLHVNPQLFDWVIENLLKNALDAIQTQEGSITIRTGERGNQYYFIDVIDTGKGIPKSQFKQVFEPGFTTKKRGWGLGLSLTRRIVENYHKGRIFVKQSEVGKGTTFRILLPQRHKKKNRGFLLWQ